VTPILDRYSTGTRIWVRSTRAVASPVTYPRQAQYDLLLEQVSGGDQGEMILGVPGGGGNRGGKAHQLRGGGQERQ
jgi:hypothetical protein